MKHAPLFAAAFGVVFLAAMPARADDTQPDEPVPADAPAGAEPAPVALDPIVVSGKHATPYAVEDTGSATRLELSPRETPQSLTVITRQRLDDQNLQSLRDVLDNTPGVYSYAYDTERVVFTSRGFFIDNLLYDGVPAATNFSTDSIDETLDTALYERIEIVRGATGLLSGAGSPSAAVNLARKRANSRSFAGEAGVTVGSWNDVRNVLDLAGPLVPGGRVRARLIGVYQHRESYQDLYENEKQVFYGTVEADLTSSTLLTLGYDYQETLPQANTWGSFPLFFSDGTRTDWPRSVTTAADWAYWNKRKQAAFAELQQRLGNWSARATFTHRQADDDLALFYMAGFPDPETGEGLTAYAYRNIVDTTTDSFDLYASGPFALFGREHELVVGFNGSRVDVEGDEFAHDELAEVGSFFEWDGSYPMPQFAAQGDRITEVDRRQNDLYAAVRLSLAEPLKLIAGARYNDWKTDHYYIYTDDEPFNHEHRKTTPYAGLIYDFSRNWSAFASYTGIFSPQNKQWQDGRFLDPIDGTSYEAGIKGEHFDGRFNSALTLFDTRQDGVGVAAFDPETGEPLPVAGTGGPNGLPRQASVPVDAQTRGFELEGSGSPVAGWNLSLGWSHYRLEDGDGNAVKTYIPRTLIRAFTTWTLPGALSGLTLGGGINWQSDSNLDVYGPNGLTKVEQDAVTLVSLLLRYQFSPQVSVQINGANLLDEKYYVLDEYGNLYYGTPAAAYAGISVRF